MLTYHPVQLIFTSYLAVSHITIAREEPEVIVFGLYGNLLDNDMKELVMLCTFTQMNDLLQWADDIADETIEQLSDIVASGITDPQTIDVTVHGGINFNLLFCVQSTPGRDTYDTTESGAYYQLAFIPKDASITDFEMSPLPNGRHLNYYLNVLSIQYDFYLHFSNLDMNKSDALHYAGLQDELIFRLAKTGYELRKTGLLKPDVSLPEGI